MAAGAASRRRDAALLAALLAARCRPCRPFVSVLILPRPLRNHLPGGSVMTCGTLVRLSTLMVGAALVLLGSPAPPGAQGQATTGIIRGVVTDPNGEPVAHATVILHEGQTNCPRPPP